MLSDTACRFPSIRKSMRVCASSSCLVGRSHSWPSQQVSSSCGRSVTASLTSSVFAIQKCDPAPFYLFDEVRSHTFYISSRVFDTIHRSMLTSTLNTGRRLLVCVTHAQPN